jgi:hypothetical protein
MSSITASKTVEVDRELVMEAIAHLLAADLVLVSLNDAIDSEAGDIFAEAGSTLKDEVLGHIEDERWLTDPAEVEIHARSSEIAATALERLADRELEKMKENELEQRFPPMSRIEGYRDLAKRTREAGTVNVQWRDNA